jgi:hypothetical protein
MGMNIECRTRNIEPQKLLKFDTPYSIFDIFLTALRGAPIKPPVLPGAHDLVGFLGKGLRDQAEFVTIAAYFF